MCTCSPPSFDLYSFKDSVSVSRRLFRCYIATSNRYVPNSAVKAFFFLFLKNQIKHSQLREGIFL